MTLPGQLHGVVVRAPHAHARILAVDGAAARAAPGVRLVLTAAEIAGEVVRPIPSFSRTAPFDIRGPDGAGENATTGAPAAIINALRDALHTAGAGRLDMPGTPAQVWRALDHARRALRLKRRRHNHPPPWAAWHGRATHPAWERVRM